MSAETKYIEIENKLKSDMHKILDDAMCKVHSEIVPYINDDTEFNAVYRAQDFVRDLLAGNFEFVDDRIVCGEISIKLSKYDNEKIINNIAKVAGDRAKDLKIKTLEDKIKELKENFYKMQSR